MERAGHTARGVHRRVATSVVRVRSLTPAAAGVAEAALAVTLGAAACASPGPPPGGPPRFVPPRLVAVAPETLAVNAHPRAVEFTFDEVINQASRGSGAASGIVGGATGLESLVLVSPRNGSVAVDWGREKLYVRPRRGFRANATYTVTILKGLSDLRSNVRDSAVIAVFSTGPAIARGELRGVVFDWVNGRPAPNAVVEALDADSVPYVALGDSTGRFVIPNMPPGTYLVRGGVDVNGNRGIDPREPFDTVRGTTTERVGPPVFTPPILPSVLATETGEGADTTRPRPRRVPTGRGPAVADTAPLGIALYAFVHDTTVPRVATVTVTDSTTLRLAFDRPLRPAQTFGPAQVRVVGADSAVVPVREVLVGSIADSIAQAAAAARAPADTTARAAPERAPAAGARPSAPATLDTVRRSVATVFGPRLQRPIPPLELVVRLGAALRPQAVYRLTTRDIRSISGVVGVVERTFSTPRPAPPPAAPAPRSPGTPGRPNPAPAATPPARPATPPPGRAP